MIYNKYKQSNIIIYADLNEEYDIRKNIFIQLQNLKYWNMLKFNENTRLPTKNTSQKGSNIDYIFTSLSNLKEENITTHLIKDIIISDHL